MNDGLAKPLVGTSIAHDSAEKHVSGSAAYIDDLPEPRALLHGYIFTSPHAHARITAIDVEAVRAQPGVAAVLTARDIRVEIARSLGEDEKRDLADALGEALHRWRNPRFDNPQLRS